MGDGFEGREGGVARAGGGDGMGREGDGGGVGGGGGEVGVGGGVGGGGGGVGVGAQEGGAEREAGVMICWFVDILGLGSMLGVIEAEYDPFGTIIFFKCQIIASNNYKD